MKVAYGEAIHLAVLDLRVRQLRDRVKADRRRDLDAEACTDPVEVLLVVDRHDA